MPNIDAPILSRAVTSRDGTEIIYYIVGRGPGLWIMPPAMGAPLLSMKYVFEHFRHAYTLVTWDMRGFYRSGAPPDPYAYGFDHHMEDMVAVLQAARSDVGDRRFVLGGWSMSVQMSLEYYRRSPDSVRALVLINGPFERALTGFLPMQVPGVDSAIGGLFSVPVVNRVGPLVTLLAHHLLGASYAAKVLTAMGIVGANPAFFQEVLGDFHGIDWGRYLHVMRALHEHSAADVLAQVRIPTLITAGERDVLTPPRIGQQMHARIHGSKLVVIPRATHYLPAEFPEQLNAVIENFLARVEV